jgi:hypothetical protein
MNGFRSLVYTVLFAAALAMVSTAPAAAFCRFPTTTYMTSLLTGTGATCSDADLALGVNLQATASAYCLALNPNGELNFDFYTTSLNSCTPNGTGKQETGTATFRCYFCSSP